MNKSEKLDELVTSVEELLVRLPESLDPEISALRDKVDDGIFDAWKGISSERIQSARAGLPKAGLGIGAAVGVAILVFLVRLFSAHVASKRRAGHP